MTEIPPAAGKPASGPRQGKREHKPGLLKSGLVVSSMTMLSRILGLVRDMVIANFFGASAAADVFFLAFKIPNFFRRLFGEGAFSQAFVPILSEYRTRRSHAQVKDLISHVSGMLGSNLLLLTVLGSIGAPLVMGLFAIGFVYTGEDLKLHLATEMLRITFPYVFLICMTAFAGATLNTYGNFFAPAFTPVWLNLTLILCAIFLSPALETPVLALAWGVLIAGVAQLTFQLPFLARHNLLVPPRISYKHAGMRRVMVLMVPAVFGVSVGQINLLLDTLLASFLETGSLSWLYYSDRLLELPLALFGITIATVILPTLSRQHGEDKTQFAETLRWAIKMVCLIGLPAAIALVILAEPLITTLFYQGEMTPRDVEMAALSLRAYAVGLLGHMMVKVLAPGYFAQQDTRTPVKYGIVALVANMVLNLILVWQLKHLGLALATSLSALLNAGLLWRGLHRSKVLKLDKTWIRFGAQAVFANGLMLICLLYLSPSQAHWLGMDFWPRLATMLMICCLGGGIYIAGLFLVGIRHKAFIR